MELNKLLSLLPADILSQLAVETKADHYSKKLQAEVIFKLLLHCLLTHKENSLRSVESVYESLVFQLLNKTFTHSKIHYSSISERLKTINPEYFEKLYKHCVAAYKAEDSRRQQAVMRFDSTILSLSSRLLEVGFQLKGSCEGIRQIKFSIGYSDIAETVQMFHTNCYTSENAALRETIVNYEDHSLCISVFDRGITSRDNHDGFTDKAIRFVSRISAGAAHKTESENLLSTPVATKTLQISEDRWIRLRSRKHSYAKHPVRCIKAVSGKGEPLWFITNVKELSAQEITELYKSRWHIEAFFKFLKQHMNFSHFINRSENGIRVMLYVTLIAAILLAAYRRSNGLKGYKLVKQKMAQELEREIIKSVLLLSKNKPDYLDQLLNPDSS